MDDKKKFLNPEAKIVELPNIDTLIESTEVADIGNGENEEDYQ